MNWIRIAVGIMDDPSILQVSEACGVSVPTTTGHVVGVLGKLPTHAKTGDLSGVTDRTIEQWAQWKGKAGRFAAAFRSYLCDAQGVVRSWEKHNGSAIREADRRAAVMRERRAARERDRHVTGNDGGTVTGNARSYVTGRDGTGRTTTTNNSDGNAVASPPKAKKAPAKFPGFRAELCDAAHARWQADAGACDYARFRKAFGPLFAMPEDVRPPQYPRDAELEPAIGLYLAAIKNTPEARFRTIEKCAESLAGIVGCVRKFSDPLAQFDAVQAFLGVQLRRAA